MIGISRATEEIIRKKPFLQEALSRGIINYVALANSLKNEIEGEIGKEVKIQAIVMALRRLSERLSIKFSDIIKFDKDTDITTQSELFEISVIKSSTVFQTLKSLYDKVDFEKGDFLTITQGIHQVTVISNKRYKKEFTKTLNKEKILKDIDNLASLTIKIPISSIDTPGLFFLVTRALTWENISIVEIVSTFTELTFILREKDITAAYRVIKNLLKSIS